MQLTTAVSLGQADAGKLLASLARMGLTEPGEVPHLEPLTGGVSSLIMRADTRRGPVCIKCALAKLKVASDWFAPVERNAAEVAWMRTAATIAPQAVPAILGEDAEARAFAMEYLAPDDHPVWKAQLRDGIVDRAFAVSLATTLVRIHGATAHSEALARAFANDATFFEIRLDPYLGATSRVPAHAAVAGALQALIRTTAGHPIALVHGDVSPKNILCGPHGPVILDAECAWFGDPAFDIAFLLNHMLLKCLWNPPQARAYLGCFSGMAQAYLGGVSWEPREAIEGRAARLLAGLFLARVDGKSPVEYITDEASKNKVRKVATALLLTPPATLEQVRAAWAAELGIS
jgi:aminoglycoside phosphotransferase (APT) family kinase protein